MRARPSLWDAVLLGLVQGPTELLPVSSSAHIALLGRLRGAAGDPVDAQLRDSLEVALHAGTALALVLGGRRELARTVAELDRGQLLAGALALGPPALVGYLCERSARARGGSPRALAAGLACGGAALALADLCPQRRRSAQAGPRDGLALGVAQALALAPGVSRNGATLTAARARGFARADAQVLSWRVGVPVLAGATLLKAWRARRRGVSPAARRTLAAGALAALASTLAAAPLIEPARRGRRLAPFALYRGALAVLAVRLGERPEPPAQRAQ